MNITKQTREKRVQKKPRNKKPDWLKQKQKQQETGV